MADQSTLVVVLRLPVDDLDQAKALLTALNNKVKDQPGIEVNAKLNSQLEITV